MKRIAIIFLVGIIAAINLSADQFDDEGYKALQEGRMPEAIDLFTKSCDGGFRNGCYSLAVMYDVTEGVEHDKPKAAKLYKKSCDKGLAYGCHALALAYDNGDGVKQSKINAVKLYVQGCEGGYGESCFAAGDNYYNGTGVKKSNAKALHFFKRACDFGYKDGCRNEHIMFTRPGYFSRSHFPKVGMQTT